MDPYKEWAQNFTMEWLEELYGQIIKFDQSENTLIVDENKANCICPINQCMKSKKSSPVLCNCSASMTGQMISRITGNKCESKVVKSVLRGDNTCVYEIKIVV